MEVVKKLYFNDVVFVLLILLLQFAFARHDFVARESHGSEFADYDVQRDVFVLDLRR